MTQTTRWSVGTAAVVALLLAAGWFLLVSPQRSDAAKLQQQAAATQTANAALEVQIQTLKAQQKQLPKMQAQLAEVRTEIPETPALPSLIRSLSDAAKAAGVHMESLAPANPAINGGQLSSQDVAIKVSGGYFEIQRFLNNLERMDRVILVTGLGIEEDAETTTTDGTTSTSTDTATSTTLIGTISGRVFLVPPATETTVTSGTAGTTTTTTTGSQPASQ